MFDLNRAIAEWRTAFERDAAFARHEIDELEAHLRDSVAARLAAGERLSEAFDAVRASLGTPPALRGDFLQVGEWSKGWPRLLRILSSVGFVLYVAFMGLMAVAVLGGPHTFLGVLVYVVAYVFTPLNVGIYIGFAALLLYRGRTLAQRAGVLLSLTATCYFVASQGVDVFGVVVGLTINGMPNSLTLLGLLALIIWNRERTWLRRALVAFGGLLAAVQAYLLWLASTASALAGPDLSFVMVFLVPTAAYLLLTMAAWSRWVRRPGLPQTA